MSVIKKLAGQTAVYGLSSIIGRFLNYLLVPLYTYTFSPEQYGVVIEFYAYVVVLQIILTYGMETGFFRFSQKNIDKNTVFSTVLTSVFSTSSIFLFLIFIFSSSVSTFIGYPNNRDYVLIFSLILAVDVFTSIFFARLRQQNKAFKFAIIKVINIAVNIALNLFFLILCPYLYEKGINFIEYIYNAAYGVGYIFISNLIATILVLIIFIPDLFKIKIKFDFHIWKQILIYSLPLLITGLTGAVNEMADRILIKYWTVVPEGTENATEYVLYQLGIYGANAKLAVIMMLFVQAFKYAAEPFFFSYHKNKDSYDAFANVMKYYIIFSFLMFLAVMMNLDFVKYFINKTYFEGLNVVLPLFLSRLLVGVFFVLSFWYKLNDVTKYGIIIFSTGAIITLSLNYFLIPKYGYIGAAWTNFAAYFVMVVFSFIWSRKYMKIKYDYFKIFLYTAIPLGLYLITDFINLSNIYLKLIINNFLILLYIIFIFKNENITLSSLKTIFNKK